MVVIVEPRSDEGGDGTRGRPEGASVPGDRVRALPLSAALRKVCPAVVKALTACAKSVTTATRGVGRFLR